ncbi:MAG: hypothetical protein ABWY20_21170 [Mycobacterium sp.]
MAEEPVTQDAPQEQPAAPESAAPSDSTPPAEQAKPARTPEEYEAELAKVRREAAANRVRVRELEPIAKRAQEAEEAEKSEVQKANERAQAAEKAYEDERVLNTRLNLAVQYHIDPEDIDFIGSGTPEEMEDRAKRFAVKTAAAAKANPPPTNQPIEGLRPGASPEPAAEPDDSYPESWKPSWAKGNERESRITHGQ